MDSPFVYCDEYLKVLKAAFNYNKKITKAREAKHVLLWGPRGHAKSEMAEYVFQSEGLIEDVDYKVIQLHKNSTFDDILGPLDMVEYMKSNYVYKTELGIAKMKYVILEEFLDISPPVAAVVKDVLTRGKFCVGGVCTPIDTVMIIGCTNVNPQEWAQSESDLATLDRFAYQMNVKWPDYTAENYSEMFKKRFNDKAIELAAALQIASNAGFRFSPRAASHAYQMYRVNGLYALKHLFGMPDSVWDLIHIHIKDTVLLATTQTKISHWSNEIASIKVGLKAAKKMTESAVIVKKASELVLEMQKSEISSSDKELFKRFGTLLKEAIDLKDQAVQTMASQTFTNV